MWRIGIILIGAILIAALIKAGKDIFKHGWHKVGWRFFTGNSLDKTHHTDATWFRRATKVTHPTGQAMKWHHLPRIHRMWIRWASFAFALLNVYGLLSDFRIYLASLEAVAAAGFFLGLFWLWLLGRRWHRNRTLIAPMAEGLEGLLMQAKLEIVKAFVMADAYLTIPAGKFGHLSLPGHFRASPKEREMVEHYVNSRIPRDVDFKWVTNVPKPRLEFHAVPEPVSMVMFNEYLALMEECKPGEVFMGLDNLTHKPYYGSFNTDDPHWGASVGSGGGKSTWLLNIIAQVLHNDLGAMASCIDPKITSLVALEGVPGVRIENDPRRIPDMWKLVADLKAKLFERLDLQKADPTAEFSCHLLIIDEINTFAAMTKKMWGSLGNKGVADVWSDIAYILWMGRVVNIHVVAVGQRLDDKSTGNIGLRDSLGFRALSRYKKNQWDMLFSGRFQKPHKKKGQWIFESSDEQTWVQCVIGDVDPTENAKIIRDWALMGRLKGDRKAVEVV